MDSYQAEVILTLLDAVKDTVVWNRVIEHAQDFGWHHQDIIEAWEALEDTAGTWGGAPEVRDFHW